MKIVILDAYTVNPDGDVSWDLLNGIGNVVAYDRTAPEMVVERAENAEIVLTNKVRITAEIMDSLPELKYIGVLATGVNVVEIGRASCRERV